MAQRTIEQQRTYLAERILVENGHHVWQGGMDRVGGPRGWDGVRIMGAHRLAFEVAYGVKLRFQDGVVVTCTEPHCINPAHLALLPRADAIRLAGTCRRGHPVDEKTRGPNGCRKCRNLRQSERLRARRAMSDKGRS